MGLFCLGRGPTSSSALQPRHKQSRGARTVDQRRHRNVANAVHAPPGTTTEVCGEDDDVIGNDDDEDDDRFAGRRAS